MVYEQISEKQLKEDIAELQEDDISPLMNYGKARKRYVHGKFWLTYSSSLKEQPINLVTTRDILEKLPHTKHFLISKEGIERL